jgi:LytS/YehU family sensor histidine kinase
MDWYCSSNTEAHIGAQPVYISNKTELIAMMNKNAYEVLAKLCDARMEAMRSRKTKNLPLYVIHPAAAGATK